MNYTLMIIDPNLVKWSLILFSVPTQWVGLAGRGGGGWDMTPRQGGGGLFGDRRWGWRWNWKRGEWRLFGDFEEKNNWKERIQCWFYGTCRAIWGFLLVFIDGYYSIFLEFFWILDTIKKRNLVYYTLPSRREPPNMHLRFYLLGHNIEGIILDYVLRRQSIFCSMAASDHFFFFARIVLKWGYIHWQCVLYGN